MSKKTVFFLCTIFYISTFLYIPLIITGTQPSSTLKPDFQTALHQYKELQKQLSPLLKTWHPVVIEREKYTISPAGIIGRLLLGGIMAGPALTVNYINQYLTKENYRGKINTLTLLVAAASATPAIRNLIGTTGTALYDALTYPNIEAIKAKNRTVEEKIYDINDRLRDLEIQLFSGENYLERGKAYTDIISLFKKPRISWDILTLQNTSKNNIRSFLEKHKDYTKETLRLLLERKKAVLISDIYNIQNPKDKPSPLFASSIGKSGDLTQAIVGGLILLPWILLEGAFISFQQPPSTLQQNKEIALIDTILAALATYP